MDLRKREKDNLKYIGPITKKVNEQTFLQKKRMDTNQVGSDDKNLSLSLLQT